MKYIGIVNEIKEKHKSGFYGKKKITKEEASSTLKQLSDNLHWSDVALFGLSILAPVTVASNLLIKGGLLTRGTIGLLKNKGNKNSSSKIELQQPIKSNEKLLIFTNDSMNNDYSINNSDFLYGLFDEFYNSKIAFEKIMKSKGGSELSIVERKNIKKQFNHINKGHFNEGIYVIHPKNENILIPLNNTSKLIESLILEETIRAYEALGAKKITISDITNHNSEMNVDAKKVNIDAKFAKDREVLREKKFGKGIYSPKRALQNKFFIQDIPSVMTTIEGRIEGNQIQEKFKETINLSLGLDTSVLNLYKGGIKYNYIREWSFDVEFYDKNDMENKNNG